MNTRKTTVAWDPELVRVEYLDDEGNPYYCAFAACSRAGSEAPEKRARFERRQERASKPRGSSRPHTRGRYTIPFSTRRFAMVILTGAVGEEIIIDGRIRIRILAINGEEARLEVNFPEFVRLDASSAHDEEDEPSRWPASSA